MKLRHLVTTIQLAFALTLVVAVCIDVARVPPDDVAEVRKLGFDYKRIPEKPVERPQIPAISSPLPRKAVSEALLKGLIRTESGGNPKAVSRTGAKGLTQLMPATAREMGVKRIFDPRQNVEGGRRYLAKLIDYYGDQTLGLMAYNWGCGNVDRWLDRGAHMSEVPKETRDYIAKVNMNAAVVAWQMAEE